MGGRCSFPCTPTLQACKALGIIRIVPRDLVGQPPCVQNEALRTRRLERSSDSDLGRVLQGLGLVQAV